MASRTKVRVKVVDGVAVIAIQGHLTRDAVQVLEQAFAAASKTGTGKILLTFRAEDELKSAGIAVLAVQITESQARGETVRIAHPSAHARWTFELMGVSQDVALFPSVEAALAGF